MASKVLQNLQAVLQKFTLQEIYDIALSEFPEITWSEIQNVILIHSEKLNISNVIKVLLNNVKDIPKEELRRRISNLYLLAIGKSLRKTWISFQLMNRIPVVKREMFENIKSSIRRTGMMANVNLIKFNNKYVLSVEKKIITKKRVLQVQTPIFFQFFLNEPYLFCTRLKIDDKIMNAIVEALGYSTWKLCNLSGPNISDLRTLLTNKTTGTNMAHLFSEPKQTPTIQITETATEFGQKKDREKYAKQIFGEKPPQLQNLSVSLKDVSWKQVGDFDEMNDTPLDDAMKLTFRAPNIAELFKEMISAGAVIEPLPDYMKALLSAGKNNLKITIPN